MKQEARKRTPPEKEPGHPGRWRVLVFTGEGKGKTTAALGMVLRAAGHGLPALVVQFVKADERTGEIGALRATPGVELFQCGRGFVPSDAAPEFTSHRMAAEEGLVRAEAEQKRLGARLVVLDEVCTAVAKGLLDEAVVLAALQRMEGQSAAAGVLVMTGRGATEGLLARADTVTEMRSVKHGFQAGWKAQAGVEF